MPVLFVEVGNGRGRREKKGERVLGGSGMANVEWRRSKKGHGGNKASLGSHGATEPRSHEGTRRRHKGNMAGRQRGAEKFEIQGSKFEKGANKRRKGETPKRRNSRRRGRSGDDLFGVGEFVVAAVVAASFDQVSCGGEAQGVIAVFALLRPGFVLAGGNWRPETRAAGRSAGGGNRAIPASA